MTIDEATAISQIANLIKEGRDDPEIAIITREVITQSGVKFGDDVGELRAIYEWVQGRIRYIRDPYGRDIYQSASQTLEVKTADCEDFSILISSMVHTIGYPVALKLASISGDIWDHIYPLVGLPPEAPTKWVAMDATLSSGRLGEEPQRVQEKSFRLANGIVSSAGEVWAPPGNWQEKILKWLPLIIIVPFGIYFITESMPGGR